MAQNLTILVATTFRMQALTNGPRRVGDDNDRMMFRLDRPPAGRAGAHPDYAGVHMGMAPGAARSSGPEVMIDLNMTPLIDVMLVMIIMFIITIPIQNHLLNLNLPISNIPPIDHPASHELTIDFDGTFYWDGGQIDRATLDARLAQVGVVPRDSQAELHIKPNRLVNYKVVASVMAMAQRDHVTRMALVGNEQFLQY